MAKIPGNAACPSEGREWVVNLPNWRIPMKSCLLALIILGLAIAPVWAKEGGDQYPNGAENWFAGSAPPPGAYYVNYLGFYSGNLKDGSGSNALIDGGTSSVDATFDALRFVEMTHLKLLGANYGVHVIVPVVHQSMDMGGRAANTGVGDIFVNPMILGWHRRRWNAVASMDVLLPTGYYDPNDARVSIGANYYSFDPLLAISYFPKSGWEASVKLMYNLKTTNPATNYHSGQEFHSDYAFGKHLRGWMVGGTGYALKQTTDDTQNGQVVPSTPGAWDRGRMGQVVAIGPSLGYSNKRGMTFMTMWQHETMVRNRFGGDKIWFKMILPIDGLWKRAPL